MNSLVGNPSRAARLTSDGASKVSPAGWSAPRTCIAGVSDLVGAWKDATSDQRVRLASTILSEIHVKDRTIKAVRPRPGWAPYFEELLRGIASLERVSRFG